MSHISSLPVAPDAQPASALSDHITSELHHYDEHLRDVRGLAEATELAMKERALAKLHEPDAKIQSYLAPDSLIDFLKTL